MKNNFVTRVKLTRREKDIIESGNRIYAVFYEKDPRFQWVEAEDPFLEVVQIVIRPVCYIKHGRH